MSTSDDSTTTLKQCTKCERFLPATANYFHRHSKKPNGLQYRCKECRGGKFGKHQRLVDLNGMKQCTRCRKVFPATTEYFHRQTVDGYKGLRSHCKLCRVTEGELRYKEKRDHILSVSRQWTRANLDKARFTAQRRIARKRSLPFVFEDRDWDIALRYFNGCCAYCGAQQSFWSKLHADHYIPVSSSDCPGTVPTNIVPACVSCNTSKNNKKAYQWMEHKFGKRKASEAEQRIRKYFSSLEK